MNSKIKAVLIEDEPHQLKLLTDLFMEQFPQLELAGTATTVADGLQLIRSTKPELVFLDVVLGSETSFDLLERSVSVDFGIIFMTSHEAYAVRAFRLAAVDYLLKPVDPEELRFAIEKFSMGKATQASFGSVKTLLSNLNKDSKVAHKVALPVSSSRLKFVAVKDIIRCEAANNLTLFFLEGGRKELICKTLKFYENSLGDYHFIRPHHSHLVNTDHIREYNREEGFLIMSDNSTVPVSRRRSRLIF